MTTVADAQGQGVWKSTRDKVGGMFSDEYVRKIPFFAAPDAERKRRCTSGEETDRENCWDYVEDTKKKEWCEAA